MAQSSIPEEDCAHFLFHSMVLLARIMVDPIVQANLDIHFVFVLYLNRGEQDFL